MNDSSTPAAYARPFARRACRARWALPAPCPAPCRVKPTSLMASIGKTQGIRFRIRPPSSAPNNAARSAGAGAPDTVDTPDAAVPAACAALASSALWSAGDTPATAATGGHGPGPSSSAREPGRSAPCPTARSALCSTSTTGSVAGLLLRSGDTGMRAVHRLPFQAWVHGLALAMICGVSGNRSRVLPRSAAGRPGTLICRCWPSGCAWPCAPSASGRGRACQAASNAAPLSAVLLRIGSCSVDRPPSGRQGPRPPLLGQAVLATAQPGGVRGDADVLPQRARREGAGHGHGNGQQHGAFVAEVEQRADGDFSGQGPGDFARLQPGRQGPVQFDRQARISRVFPVGVPPGLVVDGQAGPQRLAGCPALGRMGQEVGPQMGRGDHAAAGGGPEAQAGLCAGASPRSACKAQGKDKGRREAVESALVHGGNRVRDRRLGGGPRPPAPRGGRSPPMLGAGGMQWKLGWGRSPAFTPLASALHSSAKLPQRADSMSPTRLWNMPGALTISPSMPLNTSGCAPSAMSAASLRYFAS